MWKKADRMIPFSLPHVPDDALDYISEALDSPMQQGDGKFSRMAEKAIESMYPGFRAFLTPSCTASLEISMILNEVSHLPQRQSQNYQGSQCFVISTQKQDVSTSTWLKV
jgi:dTDP-4-amino-4,6-dideoxygalactose transaminase